MVKMIFWTSLIVGIHFDLLGFQQWISCSISSSSFSLYICREQVLTGKHLNFRNMLFKFHVIPDCLNVFYDLLPFLFNLQSGAYDLVGTIVYEIDQHPYQSTFYNGTIEVTEVGGMLSVESVFLFCLAVALLALLGFWIQSQIQNFSKVITLSVLVLFVCSRLVLQNFPAVLHFLSVSLVFFTVLSTKNLLKLLQNQY